MGRNIRSILPFTRPEPTSSRETEVRSRNIRESVPNPVRNEFIAFCGEFGGTFMFLFIAFAATQVANASAPATPAGSNTLTQTPNTANLLYISLAFGFSLAVNAWAFFRISGGLFNPAVGKMTGSQYMTTSNDIHR
jgi:aquaporin rerated protein, other eukaryote